MSKRCYYEVLGVERTVSDGELKSAFRKLALKWHPDRNPGDASCEVRFKEINEAYDILKDPEKRAQYDRFGHAFFQQGGVGGATGFGANFGPSFSDLFEGIFGMGAARPAQPDRGSDLRYNLEITLEEAFAGKTAELRLPTTLSCEDCSGTGAKAGTRARTCPECGGAGSIRYAQSLFTLERTCVPCQGRGRVIDNPCQSCAGAGRMRRERTVSINVPPGVEDGVRIRLAGEGEGGDRGGRPGDLYVFVSIASHAIFERNGADLHCRVPISMAQAALGAEIEVPTIDRRLARLRVPEGTQSGRRFRLKGKGMPILRSRQSGDMYVEMAVETPQKLSRRQRELLNEFEKLSHQVTPSSWGSEARDPVGA